MEGFLKGTSAGGWTRSGEYEEQKEGERGVPGRDKGKRANGNRKGVVEDGKKEEAVVKEPSVQGPQLRGGRHRRDGVRETERANGRKLARNTQPAPVVTSAIVPNVR